MELSVPFTGHTQNLLLHMLLRSGTAMPIEAIAAQIGITKTAARQHILNLQQSGYVQAVVPIKSKNNGRGRPTYAYEITDEGRELFTRHYALFSEKTILLLKIILPEKQFKKQMQELGKSIAEDFIHKIPKPKRGETPDAETISRLVSLLQELGYDAKQIGDTEVTAHNCVFHKLAEKHEDICVVDLALMQKLTGKKPLHKECMVRGGTACRFVF